MSGNNEKRMIADTGFEVKHSIQIGDREILIGENMDDQDGEYYLKAEYTNNALMGQYYRMISSSSYLAVMEEFIGSINRQIVSMRSEIGKAEYQARITTSDDCHPNDYGQDITGEVVAIKASALRPEYRRGDVQLVFVTHGSGARSYPRGSSVYCYHLSDGAHTKYMRYDVQGVIKELPGWAKERLVALQAEQDAERLPIEENAQPEKVGSYTITERIQVDKMTYTLGENPEAPSPFGTWQHSEGRTGYDVGHYFTDRDKAAADLTKRVNEAREMLSLSRDFKLPEREYAR